MRKISVLLCAAAMICTTSCGETEQSIAENRPISDAADLVASGEYLVMITGCNDCHSPKRMGPQGPELIPELILSGYPGKQPIPKFNAEMARTGMAQMSPDMTAAAGPWGISFAANLTPDPTGIGNWSYEQFKKALKQGKHKGLDNERMLLPPMPWFNYTSMTEDDTRAIFEYLKSIKPVANTPPQPAALP